MPAEPVLSRTLQRRVGRVICGFCAASALDKLLPARLTGPALVARGAAALLAA